jgi:Zn-dependent M28 family amino/carboxypeptidase
MLRSLFPAASAALLVVSGLAGCGESGPRFAEDRLLSHIATLSSDDFGGRAPASPGEEKTVAYLTGVFEGLGLEPGNPDGTWVQAVPLVGSTAVTMQAASDPGGDWEPAVDFVAWTKRVVPGVSASGELLFVGYGVQAPEYGWDDFGDADLAGKILVVLVNDPPGDHHFGGDAMTYYGRWTYKFEKAAAMGALGALIVHETGPAGYPWEVVSGSWTGEQFDLRTPGGNMDRLQVEGWISRERAVALFTAAGLDFDEAREAAAGADFSPMPLETSVSFTLETSHREIDSNNVVARLPGAEAPGETIIYTAHWDHLGTALGMEGDNIFNGAFDNATGTTGLLALAEAFAAEGAPRRSVLFLAVTAEEQGLLGSRHYAENPLYPAAETVAALNMDGMNVWGRTTDITVVGLGQSELDDLAAAVAAEAGRTLTPDPEPENGYYYRSDHFEFAKVGIPAFYPDGGVDFIGKPPGFGMEARATYVAEAYHKPGDEVEDWYDLSGMVDDLEFLYQMGRRLADSADWPGWSATSEFRAAREADRP